MVAAAAEAVAGASAVPGCGRPPPPPGLRPLQVSPVLGMSAASSGPVAPAQAAHLLLLPPPPHPGPLCIGALPRRGTQRGAQGGQEGVGTVPDLRPSLRRVSGFPGRASPAAEPSTPRGAGEGVQTPRASLRPRRHAQQHPDPHAGLRGLRAWVLPVSAAGLGRAAGLPRAPRRGAGCSARAPLGGRRAGPRPRPRLLHPPRPPPLFPRSRPFAAAAVTQRAENGCGPGLPVRPLGGPRILACTSDCTPQGEPAAPLRVDLFPKSPRFREPHLPLWED